MSTDPRILADVQANQWAMLPSALEGMLKLDAVTSDFGQRVEGTFKTYKAGNVGVLDVSGPIVPRSSWLANFFGLANVEDLSAGFRVLEADAEVNEIVLFTDTPGGAITGISDFSEQIAASTKSTTAYVSGMLASAGYWFGSAADRIISSRTGLVGSIGVIATATAWDEPGKVTVVSSQSPKKNQGVDTKEGLAALQRIVDDLGAVFVDAVASNRSIPPESVSANYGEGAVFGAADALKRGMIDGITTFQALMGQLQNKEAAASGTTEKGTKMNLETLKAEHREVFEAAVEEGKQTERQRVEAHLLLGAASGDLDTAVEAIKAGDGMDMLITAKYQAASMIKAQTMARTADNPENIDGQKGDGAPGGNKADAGDAVADLVCAGMSEDWQDFSDYEGGEA